MKKLWLLLALGLLMIVACQATPTPTPTRLPLTDSDCEEEETSSACGLPGVSTPTETPMPVCTPPACALGEEYYCAGECPGGCGTTCATPTPLPTGPIQIVYSEADQLKIILDNSEPQTLTTGGPDTVIGFSPDGHRVLFQRALPPSPAGLSRSELRLIDIDGQNERRLLGPEDLPTEQGVPMGGESTVTLERFPERIAWQPGGNLIAFTTHLDADINVPKNDLWTLNLTDGKLTQILDEGQGGAFAFSPDGQWLMIGGVDKIVRVKIDGTQYTNLVNFQAVNTASEYAFRPQPVWPPDQNSYALALVSSPEPFNETPSATLWKLPIEGEAEELTTLTGEFLYYAMEDRIWSTQRDLMAYVQDGQLYLAKSDGSAAEPYAQGVNEFIEWVPGTHNFVFTQGRIPEFYLGAPGQEPQRLVLVGDATSIMEIRWADPQTFVYRALSGDSKILQLGYLDKPHRQLTIVPGTDPIAFDVYP